MASRQGTIKPKKVNGKTKYQGVWELEPYQAEQIGQKSLTKLFNTKVQAYDWLAKQRALYGDGNGCGQYLTLNAIYEERYLKERITDIRLNNIKSSTVSREEKTYKSHLKNSAIGNTPLKDLKAGEIDNFLSNKFLNGNLSYSTVYKHIYSLICGILKYAYKNDLLQTSLHDKLKKPPKNAKPPKDVKGYTQGEMLKLLETSQELWSSKKQGRINLGFFFMAFTGLRVGELLDLKWSEINFEERTALIDSTYSFQKDYNTGKSSFISGTPKTKSSKRLIGLNNNAINILLDIKSRNLEIGIASNYVICSEQGSHIDQCSLRRSVIRLLKIAEVEPINDLLHSTRHFYASTLRNNGVSEDLIAKFLGHSTTASTANYIHTDNENVARQMQSLNPIDEPNKGSIKSTADKPNADKNKTNKGKIIYFNNFHTA